MPSPDKLPEAIVFFKNASAPGKSNGGFVRVPSRDAFTLDLVIGGAAVVNVYASNISDDINGSHWGPAVKQVTSTKKLVIENEPWLYWMVEIASVTGTVTAIAGA